MILYFHTGSRLSVCFARSRFGAFPWCNSMVQDVSLWLRWLLPSASGSHLPRWGRL